MLHQIQDKLNRATVRMIALNKTLSDLITVQESPSIIPIVDEALTNTLHAKFCLLLSALGDDLSGIANNVTEAFGLDEQ